MIKVINLKKQYKLSKSNIVKALRGVDFEIKEGEIAGLIGPSGSGKSTILNILGGMDRQYEGEVLVDGQDIKGYEANFYRRQIVGTIFQQFYLIPSLNVLENVMLPSVFFKVSSKKEIKKRALTILERVGLKDRVHHLPKELSGGQAQRVAIARALIARPRIILADEPTGNLDSVTGKEILKQLVEINKEDRTTIVIVTHDSHIIEEVEKKVFLKDGQIA